MIVVLKEELNKSLKEIQENINQQLEKRKKYHSKSRSQKKTNNNNNKNKTKPSIEGNK